MDLGKVIYNDIDYEDDSSGVVRLTLEQSHLNRLTQEFSHSTIFFGDAYLKPKTPLEGKNADLFFRINHDLRELRICAEMTLNEMQSPMYYANVQHHAKLIKKDFDLQGEEKFILNGLEGGSKYAEWFTKHNETFKRFLSDGDYEYQFAVNVNRILITGAIGSFIVDQINAIFPWPKEFEEVAQREAFLRKNHSTIEAVFFGESISDIDGRVFALRDFLGLESLNYAQKPRFDMIKEHIPH